MHFTDTDTQLLDAVPSFVSISPLLKATPRTEGDRRFVYVEASNETVDQQGEIVLAKALEDSQGFFRKFGNLDLEHYTVIGAKAGIPNHESYEIGVPVDVRLEKGATFVKGEIYQGSGDMAAKANMFWSSMTEQNPPKRWYTSVGGAVLAKSIEINPKTGDRVGVVSKVRWSNLAFSATPVNANLLPASVVPFGPLVKAWGDAGWDVLKSLTAGHETDSAAMTGGSALREQSLDRKVISYAEFREALAAAFTQGSMLAKTKNDLVQEAGSRFGLPSATATRYVGRFLDDLKRGNQEPL